VLVNPGLIFVISLLIIIRGKCYGLRKGGSSGVRSLPFPPNPRREPGSATRRTCTSVGAKERKEGTGPAWRPKWLSPGAQGWGLWLLLCLKRAFRVADSW